MADLKDLMKIDGALGAFAFNDKGELTQSEIADGSGLNDTVLDLLAHVCVANTAIATMQARGWENMTGMGGFYPIKGFSMIGFEFTIVANAHAGVIMPNNQADFEAAYAALNG